METTKHENQTRFTGKVRDFYGDGLLFYEIETLGKQGKIEINWVSEKTKFYIEYSNRTNT